MFIPQVPQCPPCSLWEMPQGLTSRPDISPGPVGPREGRGGEPCDQVASWDGCLKCTKWNPNFAHWQKQKAFIIIVFMKDRVSYPLIGSMPGDLFLLFGCPLQPRESHLLKDGLLPPPVHPSHPGFPVPRLVVPSLGRGTSLPPPWPPHTLSAGSTQQ